MMLPLFLALAVGLTVSMQSASTPADDFDRMTPEQIISGIEARHPAAFYVLAGKLFAAGRRDEAAFWFYAGQLRYRFHLAASPNLPPDGDPALFASLSEVIGRPINEYAFGDLAQLTATIDKVLGWDERTDNAFTSKTVQAASWKEIRDGLGRLKEYVKTNGDEIRKQRTQNGLENRKPKS